MSFTVRLTNGNALTDVADQTIVQTACPISLVGRGAVNYAQAHSENFVHVAENFASATAPAVPLVGQQWYDTSVNQMKLWNGDGWVPAGGGGTGDTGTLAQGSRVAGFTGAVLSTTNGKVTIGVILAEGVIVGAVSNVNLDPATLPASIVIGGYAYTVAARFPQGIKAGLTIALSSGAAYTLHVSV